MGTFEIFRAVGCFDVYFAPLNGIGVLDVLVFSKYVEKSLKNGRKNIGLDLSGLATINSGAYNCLLQSESMVTAAGGEFILIVDNEEMENSLRKYGIWQRLTVFKSEVELLNYSIKQSFKKPAEPLPKISEPKKKTGAIIAPSAFEDDEEASGANLWVLAIVAIIGVGIILLYLFL